MANLFLVVIFAGIFITPLVWGAFIAAQDADQSTINGWFGLATLDFIVVAAIGALFLFMKPT